MEWCGRSESGGGETVVTLRSGVMRDGVVVMLWARWICAGVWRGSLGIVVSDVNGDVWSKFGKRYVGCFEVEVERSDSVSAGGKLYDVLSL